MNILKEEIDRWLKDEASVGLYREGIHLLKESGIIELLRRMAVPGILDNGESLEVTAGQAHQAAGFSACLDELLYFERLHTVQDTYVLEPPDFGGRAEAVRKGLIREGEI